MIESHRTIPAFSVSLEIDVSRLVDFYSSLRDENRQNGSTKLTYTDLILRALALALEEIKEMNAVWRDAGIHRREQVDLGLAIATERGVIVPVLQDVSHMRLEQIAQRRSALSERAREGRLSLTDLEGGVGALSNLGMYGVDRFQGLIHPGQSFLLAAGTIRNRPWVREGNVVAQPTVILTLSVDHRVADGAAAGLMLERLGEILENPALLARAQSPEKPEA
jgi:pyruvate dehydrogenase E2 component (dihydrolipoamide acetyltransferase)